MFLRYTKMHQLTDYSDTKRDHPEAILSCNLSESHTKCTVTELELLSVVEFLNEFQCLLWAQLIKVYMDYKNLVRCALRLSSDQVHWWRLY